MPVDKSSASFMRLRASSPYTASLHTPRVEKQSHVRIYTPSIDDHLFSNDFAQYDGFDESNLALSLWTNAGSFPDSEMYGSTSACPPSFIPPVDDRPVYDEPIDSPGFPWPYDGVAAGYDASYPDSSSSANAFSPSISIVSSSPRSEHSLSLSPQPPFPEYSTAFNFDFSTTSNPLDFPTSSSPSPSNWSGQLDRSPKSESHSPALSASSLDPSEIKSSPSREPSPLQIEPDPQNARRRFPCLILGCERRFTSQYTLKVHMEAHKPKPRVSFPCTLGCSERFSRQHDRLRHEVAKHGKVCEFSCDECGRFFSTKKTLGNHKCPVAQGGTRWVNS